MNKTIVIATVVALACGGAGVAIGAAAFARAEEPTRETTRTEVVRTTTATRVEAPVSAPASAPSPAPARVESVPARIEPAPRAALRARRLVLTTAVEAREPVDAVETLDAPVERVFAFVEVANDGDGAGELTITFEHQAGGIVTGHVTLEVPPRVGRWRTWGSTRGVDRAGAWRAVVRDERGRVLAEQAFEVR